MKQRHDPACPLCFNAYEVDAEHGGGWWGDDTITHCAECGNTWKRTSRICECVRCHILFGGSAGADQHITRAGHVHPSTVGLVETVNEFGSTVWRREVEIAKAS
jgi:hypothetical protein